VNKNKLNFIFWGTPEVASETLEILKESGYVPSLIVTAPDKPQGRKMLITPPPVKVWAEKNNIPYLQPEKLNEEFSNKLKATSYELSIVVAYGKIMPEEIINMSKLGSINIHYSLLPKYRGASPVESAILNGETKTGVTIQKMKFKMDAGPILAEEKTNIFPDEKAGDLRKRLIKIGGEMIVKLLTPSASGTSPLSRGRREGVYDAKITLGEVNLETYKQIEQLAPFGVGNPKPIFLFENITVNEIRQFGKGQEHLEITFLDENGPASPAGKRKIKAISFFSQPEKFIRPPMAGGRINMLAHIELSRWNGSKDLRLRIVDII